MATEELGFRLIDWKPVARSNAAQNPLYPWGPGYDPDFSQVTPGGDAGCAVPTPGRKPFKWPRTTDWRNPGFQPWSLRTSTPQVSAWEATVELYDADIPWPDLSDDGRTVLVIPQSSPDGNATAVLWSVSGITGGEIDIVTRYVSDVVATTDYPRGSLETRSLATTGNEKTGIQLYQSRWKQWRPSRDYVGEYEFFGPMWCQELSLTGPIQRTDCGNCVSSSTGIQLGDVGVRSNKPGGELLHDFDGWVLPGTDAVALCNFAARKEVSTTGDIGGGCTQYKSFVAINAELYFEFDVPAGRLFLSLDYIAGVDEFFDPTDDCRQYPFSNCCLSLSQVYGCPHMISGFTGGWGVEYRSEGPVLDCNSWAEFINSTTLVKQVTGGTCQWASSFPDTLTLQLLDFSP